MRARGKFDPDALKDRLGTFSATGAPIAPALSEEYRRFYHLDFEQVAPGWQHHMGWLSDGSERLMVQLFVPQHSVGSAVFCHGYFDHVGLFEHVLRYLLSKRLTVLAFDQPGHGLSTGERATIESFARYVQALQRCLTTSQALLPRPCFGVGQSMGGAILLEHSLTHDWRFDDVVLFAPLVRPAHWGVNRLLYEVAKRTVTERPRAITANAENSEFLALQQVDPLAPMRLPVAWVTAMVDWMRVFEKRQSLPQIPKVIQGDADQTVAWRYNIKVLQRLVAPAALPLLEIPKGRHHLANESQPLREMIWQWLDEVVDWPG
ncbi:MAG: alpha/beta hydrolase [Pseudomonadales bacterium]